MSTDLGSILGRLERVKPTGGQYLARCPAHEDEHQSLAIKQAPNGTILLKCHSGCETAKVLAELGLRFSDLSTHTPASKPAERIVATYDYTDECGHMLYQVVRFDPKSFRQRRPDGSVWSWDLAGVRRVLYRLPALINAVKAGHAIYIAEGEKDVNNLVKLGASATTNSGGAAKWQPEFSRCFTGAHVAILPDNDGPGWQHACVVAKSILPAAKSVRVVNLPGLPPKGDVSDWIAKGGTLTALREAARFGLRTSINEKSLGGPATSCDILSAAARSGLFNIEELRKISVRLDSG